MYLKLRYIQLKYRDSVDYRQLADNVSEEVQHLQDYLEELREVKDGGLKLEDGWSMVDTLIHFLFSILYLLSSIFG